MFAGIVEDTGVVTALRNTGSQREGIMRVQIDLGELSRDLPLGASVAVNGVCLTVADLQGAVGGFDVIPETLARTTLASLRPGAKVNLERSLRVGDRIDGHFVQGHVDAIGRVESVGRRGGEWRVWLTANDEVAPLLIPKGSVAIDGVSLTIAETDGPRFSVALIPTTLARTTLGALRAGDSVNIETDLLARVIVQRLEAMGLSNRIGARGLSYDTLREQGFAP
ncbi:MAG: riboflavin synthase [Planctomycetota bacterium]|nr:MAG: riboflavin synthase [Planctomycetota bacterium]